MNARQLRSLRGTAAAAVAAWTAAVSHTVAGGTAPNPALLLVVVLLAAPVAVAFAGRRMGVIRLSLTVVLTQLLLHVTFALTAGLDPTAGAHVHEGHLALGGTAGVVTPGPLMTAAHLVAAAATILVIHRGERMLRAVAAGLLRLIRPVLHAVLPIRTAPRTAPVALRVRSIARTLPSDVSRRGPPRVVVAA